MNAKEALEHTKEGVVKVQERCDKWEKKIFKQIKRAARKGDSNESFFFRGKYDLDVDILQARLEKLGYKVKAYELNGGSRFELEVDWWKTNEENETKDNLEEG